MKTSSLISLRVFAEAERKMRKREAKLAWLLAFKAGVTLENRYQVDNDRVEQVLCAETDEQKRALDVASQARASYISAAARAGSLRSGLVRSVRIRLRLADPTKNAEIEAAYSALCAAEEAARPPLEEPLYG